MRNADCGVLIKKSVKSFAFTTWRKLKGLYLFQAPDYILDWDSEFRIWNQSFWYFHSQRSPMTIRRIGRK